MNISSHNEWSRLRSVVVGRADWANWPSTQPEYYREQLKTRWPHTPAPTGPVPAWIVDQVNHQLEQLCAVLVDWGCEVYRPLAHNHQWRDAFYSLCPRDRVLIVGEHVINCAMQYDRRTAELEEMSFIQPTVTVPQHSWFDAANVMRCGRDVVYLVSVSGSPQGAEWLQQHLGNDYTVWPVESVYQGTHIDTTMIALNDHTVMINAGRMPRNRLPRFMQDWQIIEVDEDMIQPQGFYQYPQGSKWMGLNVLSLDHQTVIVDRSQQPLIRELRGRHFEVIELNLSHARTLGGGFHCVTLDLVRKDPE